MKKKTKQFAQDNRGVAIHARKSRITNKGDSIGVQFKQCAEYAKRKLSLDDDYNFINYEDKGLSGYYSDRPDFQRLPAYPKSLSRFSLLLRNLKETP